MFTLGNGTFAALANGRLRRLAVRRKLEDACWRRSHAHCRRRHAPGTQTEPQVEPATSAGVILPETGQFLLLCSLQLWQQLKRCGQTRARVQGFWRIFFFRSTETVRRERHVSYGNEQLQANVHVKKLAAGLLYQLSGLETCNVLSTGEPNRLPPLQRRTDGLTRDDRKTQDLYILHRVYSLTMNCFSTVFT